MIIGDLNAILGDSYISRELVETGLSSRTKIECVCIEKKIS